jgi:hypothetical protein
VREYLAVPGGRPGPDRAGTWSASAMPWVVRVDDLLGTEPDGGRYLGASGLPKATGITLDPGSVTRPEAGIRV